MSASLMLEAKKRREEAAKLSTRASDLETKATSGRRVSFASKVLGTLGFAVGAAAAPFTGGTTLVAGALAAGAGTGALGHGLGEAIDSDANNNVSRADKLRQRARELYKEADELERQGRAKQAEEQRRERKREEDANTAEMAKAVSVTVNSNNSSETVDGKSGALDEARTFPVICCLVL
uniref:Uncharacterized protein n=1 Tax=viral metagenome TaxID=1070528 RepID=A0A2V0RBS8_9ZZZZ